MDDRDRDKFYSASKDPADAADDSTDEYELEQPDAGILSAEDRHAKEAFESVKVKIDIDEIYREAERERGAEILQQWMRNFQFRFQVKHLLIGTAVVAIALTLAKLGLLWPVLIIFLMLSIVGLFMYLSWEERKQQAAAERKRQELYARRRAQLGQQSASRAGANPELPAETTSVAEPLLPSDVDRTWQEAMSKERFRFRFSLRELIMAMTAAAVILGMVRVLGSPSTTATVLGFVALFGLMIHALGYDPPQIVVLGWWFTLVLYVLLSIFAAVWAGFA